MSYSLEIADAVFAHPARILAPTLEIDRLVKLVEERHAFDPEVLRESGRELFFFPAQISNGRLDTYYTRMAQSSLRNYAIDAADGRSFQNSHNWKSLGFGRTLTGEVQDDEGTEAVLTWIYTVSGLRLNEVSTDDLIAGIRTGIIKDVSIGFFGGMFRCSICNRDLLHDWDCTHYPGFKYARADGSGEDIAFAWVEEAHLAEVSAVFDGATPGAVILKAQRDAEEGLLDERARRLLETRYRMALPATRRTWSAKPAGAQNGQPAPSPTPRSRAASQLSTEGKIMSMLDQFTWDEQGRALVPRSAIEPLVTDLEAAQQRVREVEASLAERTAQHQALSDANQKAEARVAELTGQVAQLEARVAELKPLAADGQQYRTDLVAEALAEGVRALGDGFHTETYQGVLESAPLAVVKRMRDDWKRQGDQLLRPGRRTQDANEPPEPEPTEDVSNRAYKA